MTVVIGAPGVEGAAPGEDYSYSALGKLEVEHVEFIYTFYAVRRVKLTENAAAPDEELLV